MSFPARTLLALLFATSAVLWALSRHSPRLQLAAYHVTADPQCQPLTYPLASQCGHVKSTCGVSTTFLSVNYLEQYFCTQPSFRPFVFATFIVWLLFLFSTLGISASDFFTPNLATISRLLGLDENVAGVTFLAFGNGSPDLSSTFSAMKAGSGSLAIGELLGAASFIVSCVVGSMCIIRPFHVYRWPFLRDVGFFTAAVALLLIILYDDKIHMWEAAVMVALYVCYALVVGFGSWWDKRQQQKKKRENMIREEYDQSEFPVPYRDQPDASPELSPLRFTSPTPTRSRAASSPHVLRLRTDLPPRGAISRTPSPSPSALVSQLPSFSLLGALEFREVVSSLQNQASTTSLRLFDSPVTPYAGGYYHAYPQSRSALSPSAASREADSWDADFTSMPLGDRPPQNRGPLIFSPGVEPENRSQQDEYFDRPANQDISVPSIHRIPPSPTSSDASEQVYIAPTKAQRFFQVGCHVFHVLFPTLHHFHKQSFLGKIASVFAAPAVLALTITLPVVVTPFPDPLASREKIYADDAPLVDFEEEGVQRVLIAEEEVQEEMHEVKFNKWLMATQCTIAPAFCVNVLFNDVEHRNWLLLAAVVGGLAVAILVAVFGEKGDYPTGRMARCFAGFLVAIVWIMAIADEVVNVLQTFGLIFGLSDAIIGLTIFAVGNSLADLVANMTVAVFAPIMGFSACFGSPMLNILLGIGVSGTYIISQTGQPYIVDFSESLRISTIGLLCILTTTLIVVPLNEYYLTRKWGILLILSYITIMIINITVEIRK